MDGGCNSDLISRGSLEDLCGWVGVFHTGLLEDRSKLYI